MFDGSRNPVATWYSNGVNELKLFLSTSVTSYARVERWLIKFNPENPPPMTTMRALLSLILFIIFLTTLKLSGALYHRTESHSFSELYGITGRMINNFSSFSMTKTSAFNAYV